MFCVCDSLYFTDYYYNKQVNTSQSIDKIYRHFSKRLRVFADVPLFAKQMVSGNLGFL